MTLVHVRARWQWSEVERSCVGAKGIGELKWNLDFGCWGFSASERVGSEQLISKVFALGMEHADQYFVYAMHKFAEPGVAVEEPAGEIKHGMPEQVDTVVSYGIRDSVA